MSLEGVPQRLYDSLQDHKMAFTVGVGTILVNALAPEAFVVYADDSFGRQAALALPSVIPVDELTPSRAVNIGSQAAFIAGTLVLADHEIKRGTTTKWGLLGTAVLSQGAACGFDALADRTWLTPEEKKLPDIGNSSVILGILTKFALDHFPDTRQRLAGAALGTIAVGATVGAYAVEGNQGGKLGMVSHAAGIAAGVLAHWLGKWFKAPARQV
jgi:hypothetical protein